MPDIFVDNRPPSLVFDDTNRLSDGMMNFANALASAPAAQARIRQQQAQMALMNAWHNQDEGRKDRAEAAMSLWREHEYELGKAKIAAGVNGGGRVALPPAHILKDLNGRVQLESERRGLMKADPVTGRVMPVTLPNGRMKPEDAAAMDEIRTQTFLDSGLDPATYKPVGKPVAIPLPSPEQQLADQARQDPRVQGLWGSAAGAARGHTQAAAAGDAQGIAGEQEHHAQNIAALYQAGNIPAAQHWIGQMRQQWGDQFADGVKQRVKELVAAPAPADAPQDGGDGR